MKAAVQRAGSLMREKKAKPGTSTSWRQDEQYFVESEGLIAPLGVATFAPAWYQIAYRVCAVFVLLLFAHIL